MIGALLKLASERQVMIVPVSDTTSDYCMDVKTRFRDAHFHVDVDVSSATMQKKVRQAQLSQYNYILVVGDQEKAAGTVNVRTRDNVVHGMHSVDDVIAVLSEERATRSLKSKFVKKTVAKGGAQEGKEGGEAA